MSASSSSSSLHQDRGRGAIPRSRASSITGSAENLYRNSSHMGMVLPRRSAIPVLSKCDSGSVKWQFFTMNVIRYTSSCCILVILSSFQFLFPLVLRKDIK